MKKAILFILTFVAASFCCTAHAQTDSAALAESKLRAGGKLAEQGRYNEAIALMKEAEQIGEESYIYTYDMGLVYHKKGDYKKCIDVLTKSIEFDDAQDDAYAILGVTYKMVLNKSKTFETYKMGLEKCPDSGLLYALIGVEYANDDEMDKAIECFKTGIKIDPYFSMNYSYATHALMLDNENANIEGMIYGETYLILEFLNLESNVDEFNIISEYLLEGYRKALLPTDGGTFKAQFVNPTDAFLANSYNALMTKAAAGHTELNKETIIKIRQKFIELWFKNKASKKYDIPILEYQKNIIKAGHYEAYSHLILSRYDPSWGLGFQEWLAQPENEEKFAEFYAWFLENRLTFEDPQI